MDLGITLGILGTLLTLISLIYAVYVTKRSKREKALVFDVLPPAPIADVLSKESSYSVRILYEKPNSSPKTVQSVFVQYLRFMNYGQVSIRREDSAKNDPICVEIIAGNVLDVSVASVTRDVCGIALGEIEFDQSESTAVIDIQDAKVDYLGERVTVAINFDFLDYLDGGLIQIITENPTSQALLKGTVIGMPEGIMKKEQTKNSITWPDPGCVIPLIIEIATLIAVPFIYKYLTGGWKGIWLLLLPVAALVLPLALTLPVVFTLADRDVMRFPEHLRPPTWYQWRLNMYEGPRRMPKED